jgi:hypothetical protein
MKKILIILFILFAIKGYTSNELIEILVSEINNILNMQEYSSLNENSKEKIKKIHDLTNKFKNKLSDIILNERKIEKEEMADIRRTILILKDFNFILANHDINSISEEIYNLKNEIENLYVELSRKMGISNFILNRNYGVSDDFCTYYLKLCNEICTKGPRIFMNNFKCELKAKSYTCECGAR